jgi:hypothetical protein
MTIRVIVKNEEATGGRTLKVMICQRPRSGSQAEQWGGDIGPQESREFHVHAAQHLIVEEKTV